MTGKSKRKFTPDFKLKVVLKVLKEKDTLAAISKRHDRAERLGQIRGPQ